jgi:tetratricopeptide (TPR) repeat protein
MRSRFTRFAVATAVLAAACQTPSPEGAKKDSPVAAVPPPVDTKTPAVPATPDAKNPDIKAPDAATVGATAGAATAGTPAADTAAATAAADSAPAADTATPAADTAADTAGTPPAVDKAKLLTEVKAKKTSDARAKKALEEAEAGGATVRELAEASNARGVALLNAGEPERATAAFEWARDKDTTYPDASFNLAKQTANAGEVPETVKHLQEVHKRGGKALLKQVGYDPTFEAVKDDPEIQKIAK